MLEIRDIAYYYGVIMVLIYPMVAQKTLCTCEEIWVFLKSNLIFEGANCYTTTAIKRLEYFLYMFFEKKKRF